MLYNSEASSFEIENIDDTGTAYLKTIELFKNETCGPLTFEIKSLHNLIRQDSENLRLFKV